MGGRWQPAGRVRRTAVAPWHVAVAAAAALVVAAPAALAGAPPCTLAGVALWWMPGTELLAQDEVRDVRHALRAGLLQPPPSLHGPPTSAAGAEPQTPAAAQPTPPPQKAKLQTDIKALETALHELPSEPEYRAQRETISEKVSSLKRLIIEAKPIGQRLDGTRSALARAKKRQEQAEAVLAHAHAALQAATDDTDRLATELACLESQFAAPVPSEPLRFDSLEMHLAAAVSELRGSSSVHASAVADAEAQVCALLDKFRRTLQTAKAAESAADADAVPRSAAKRAQGGEAAACSDFKISHHPEVPGQAVRAGGEARRCGSPPGACAGRRTRGTTSERRRRLREAARGHRQCVHPRASAARGCASPCCRAHAAGPRRDSRGHLRRHGLRLRRDPGGQGASRAAAPRQELRDG